MKKIKKQTRWDENSSPDESDADDNNQSRRHKKVLNSTMKPTRNNDMETTIPSDHQTMPEDPNPMRQMTHYFSVPETPRDRIQPLGIKSKTRIPETPDNQEMGEKSKNKSEDPSTRNKERIADNSYQSSQSIKNTKTQDKTSQFNKNIITQDDALIQELINESENKYNNDE